MHVRTHHTPQVLCTCRAVPVEGLEHFCRVTTLERTPPSRHLCAVPRRPHSRADEHRHLPPVLEEAGKGGGGGGGGGALTQGAGATWLSSSSTSSSRGASEWTIVRAAPAGRLPPIPSLVTIPVLPWAPSKPDVGATTGGGG